MGRKVYKKEMDYIAYDLAKEGKTERKIAKILGISFASFVLWEKKKAHFGIAIQRGRKLYKSLGGAGLLKQYIYQRLSPRLKKIWDKINVLDKKYPNTGGKRIEALLSNRGVTVRQNLFIHALVSSNFSVSQAMHKLNVSRRTFDNWKKDAEFDELVGDIMWHKENFFEDSLIRLVASGDSSAILFANRTQNRGRGYNDKQVIEHQGEISHAMRFSELDLSIKIKKQILKAIRRFNEGQTKGDNDS